jgi:Ca2+-binding EF-hand superfamily protein
MAPIFRGILANSKMPPQLLAVALIMVSATAARAEKKAVEGPSAGDAALFDRLDTNHDGSLASSEISAENRSLFDRLLRRGDSDHDQALSRKEFLASLVPTRPEKSMEEKEPATLPGANAIRYLLLTMDANRNARIEKDEVPKELQAAADMMFERIDRNDNGALERQELSRGGGAMSAVAARYVARQGIDVEKELAKLKKSQGDAFDRFEQQPVPLEQLKDAKQARQLFAQFDENADGKLESKEVPEPLQERIQRLVNVADRDRDGKLSEEEFTTATERISRFLKRGGPEGRRMDERKGDGKSKPSESASKKTAKN